MLFIHGVGNDGLIYGNENIFFFKMGITIDGRTGFIFVSNLFLLFTALLLKKHVAILQTFSILVKFKYRRCLFEKVVSK